MVGRYTTPFASGGPAITRLVALDTTPATGGNVNGIGVVDVTTQRLFDKLSFAETYPNALTSTATTAVKIPMVMADDLTGVNFLMRTIPRLMPSATRLTMPTLDPVKRLTPRSTGCRRIHPPAPVPTPPLRNGLDPDTLSLDQPP